MAEISPQAQFIKDMLGAVNRAANAGVSAGKMADLMADTLADLRDLDDDDAWPGKAPETIGEARAQLDARKPR